MPITPATPPVGFRYMPAYLKGRPQHAACDSFSLRHPSMDPCRRAKIFAPFDALCGFSDAVAATEIQYEGFRELDEERAEFLSRKLAFLQPLVKNSRTARKNRIRIAVTYFCPCEDQGSEYDGILGQYHTREGILNQVDVVHWQLLLDDCRIDLDDIYDIGDPEGRLFHHMTQDDDRDDSPDDGRIA